MGKIELRRTGKFVENYDFIKLEVERGDLLMYSTGAQYYPLGKVKAFSLGIFDKVVSTKASLANKLRLIDVISLREVMIFGGVKLPGVIPLHKISPSWNKELTLSAKYIREIYAGKRDILAHLDKTSNLAHHTEWISRLRRPYVWK